MNKLIVFLLLFSFTFVMTAKTSYACCKPPCISPQCPCCKPILNECQEHCISVSTAETGSSDRATTTMGHVTDEFRKQRIWMIDIFFNDEKANDPPGLRGAMKLMTSQLVTNGMQQVQIIGSFFDAKHQLETQRLFQQLTARAHKDYHPSEELCEFGTVTKSLASSARNTELSAAALAKRSVDRQVLAKDMVGTTGVESDQLSRLAQFIKKYCNKESNAKNLDLLCKKQKEDAKKELFNKDVSYTTTVDTPLTLDLDFSKQNPEKTEDEEALFALSANLFAHTLMPVVPATALMSRDNKPAYEGAAQDYMDARALIAKRSVAGNSLTSIAALKSKGNKESQPFIYALIQEMSEGKDDPPLSAEEIKELIGERPSYYAQMEILTKKLYQNPGFYSDLYDKPVNVMRKDVALQAAELMQKRDIFRSLLRSEAVMAVMLETALMEEQEKIKNEANPTKEE